MEKTITYDEGHAHVAAVRVLTYRDGRPPTIEEVAAALGSKVELTNYRLRALEERGIISIIESPFEAHITVRDYLALEKLPTERSGPGLAEAVQDFQRRQQEKAGEMLRIFEETDEAGEKKTKQAKFESDFRRFKEKKTKRAPWEKSSGED